MNDNNDNSNLNNVDAQMEIIRKRNNVSAKKVNRKYKETTTKEALARVGQLPTK